MEKRVADIPMDRLIRELALRGNPFITTMSSFYYEDGTNMAIWNMARNFGSEEYDDYLEHQTVINKRTPSVLYYTTDENLRNYVVSDVNS
jgi:hypothetical protein